MNFFGNDERTSAQQNDVRRIIVVGNGSDGERVARRIAEQRLPEVVVKQRIDADDCKDARCVLFVASESDAELKETVARLRGEQVLTLLFALAPTDVSGVDADSVAVGHEATIVGLVGLLSRIYTTRGMIDIAFDDLERLFVSSPRFCFGEGVSSATDRMVEAFAEACVDLPAGATEGGSAIVMVIETNGSTMSTLKMKDLATFHDYVNRLLESSPELLWGLFADDSLPDNALRLSLLVGQRG